MSEEWRPVPDFEDIYMVSDHGRVLSLRRGKGSNSDGRIVTLTAKPPSGYLVTSFSKGGKVRQVYVHRLVAEAFIGPGKKGLHCAHLDGNPSNNHKDNLEWVTPRVNHSHKERHGTVLRGEKHPNSKLTADDVVKIRARRTLGESVHIIAQDFGIHKDHIYLLTSRRQWTHV